MKKKQILGGLMVFALFAGGIQAGGGAAVPPEELVVVYRPYLTPGFEEGVKRHLALRGFAQLLTSQKLWVLDRITVDPLYVDANEPSYADAHRVLEEGVFLRSNVNDPASVSYVSINDFMVDNPGWMQRHALEWMRNSMTVEDRPTMEGLASLSPEAFQFLALVLTDEEMAVTLLELAEQAGDDGDTKLQKRRASQVLEVLDIAQGRMNVGAIRVRELERSFGKAWREACAKLEQYRHEALALGGSYVTPASTSVLTPTPRVSAKPGAPAVPANKTVVTASSVPASSTTSWVPTVPISSPYGAPSLATPMYGMPGAGSGLPYATPSSTPTDCRRFRQRLEQLQRDFDNVRRRVARR